MNRLFLTRDKSKENEIFWTIFTFFVRLRSSLCNANILKSIQPETKTVVYLIRLFFPPVFRRCILRFLVNFFCCCVNSSKSRAVFHTALSNFGRNRNVQSCFEIVLILSEILLFLAFCFLTPNVFWYKIITTSFWSFCYIF